MKNYNFMFIYVTKKIISYKYEINKLLQNYKSVFYKLNLNWKINYLN